MRLFFTTDHHFGHANIIEFCDRPFGDVDDMDANLIEEWNAVVGTSDIVYHLGDFFLGHSDGAKKYFSQLNGCIHFMATWWHHDRRWLEEVAIPGELSATITSGGGWNVHLMEPLAVIGELGWTGWHYYSGVEQPPIVLCHYPLAVWDRKHYGAIHLHSHSHGRHKAEGRILDVGVDSAYKLTGKFAPLETSQVLDFMSIELRT